MRKSVWLNNPWKRNPWFETVAVAHDRARKRLPKPIYAALVAGTEAGRSLEDNERAFFEIELAPRVARHCPERSQSTTVMGQQIALPVILSPTGVQAVHPDGEVAVARAAASRGTIVGLSNFASKSIEEVTATGAATLFQVYWTGDRNVMLERLQRAHSAGVIGLIVTLDWSFSTGRDWGSPEIPEKVDPRTLLRLAPLVAAKPRWLVQFARSGFPDLTAPNMAPPGGKAPTFFAAYYEWMTTPPPSWADVAWLRDEWAQMSGTPFMLKGICRVDDAKRAIDAGCDAISVSNHGGNNLDGTPAPIRMVQSIAEAVGTQIEVVMDGGVRRGSDVIAALAFGARAVMIGRAYLWGLAANGQNGVENVLDILRSGIDSALLGMGRSAIEDLSIEDLIIPRDFRRELGASLQSG